MTQKYEPVEWTDETPTQPGTLINKARLDQMQSAHHFADGFEEVDAIPTEDPGTDYHKVVYCTADSTFYRWDGNEWTADIDDDTKRLLEEHEADHANPHQVTKAQVGLGNADNTADLDKPISTATAAALATKANDSAVVHRTGDETISGSKTFMADTNNTFLLKGETALGAELKIGSEATGSDPLGQITFIKLPTLATVANIESDAAGLLTLMGSTAVTIRNQRAYNASNTSDVVTIGTLDAYTPMVRTVNNQTIAGAKTFTDAMVLATSTDNAILGFRNTDKYNTAPAANKFNVIRYLDSDNTEEGRIVFQHTTGGSKAIRNIIIGQNGVSKETAFTVNADGTTALTSSNQRAYNTANEADVVTIGTLKASTDVVHRTGNETIDGIKTFLSDAYAEIAIKSTRTNAGQNIGGLHFIDGNGATQAYITGTVNGRVLFDLGNSTVKAVQIPQHRAYDPANVNDVATIGTLDAYTPMVRTSGNQIVGGFKEFRPNIGLKATSLIWGTAPSTQSDFGSVIFEDNNGANICQLSATYNTDGTTHIYVRVKNRNGTYKTQRLLTSD